MNQHEHQKIVVMLVSVSSPYKLVMLIILCLGRNNKIIHGLQLFVKFLASKTFIFKYMKWLKVKQSYKLLHVLLLFANGICNLHSLDNNLIFPLFQLNSLMLIRLLTSVRFLTKMSHLYYFGLVSKYLSEQVI